MNPTYKHLSGLFTYNHAAYNSPFEAAEHNALNCVDGWETKNPHLVTLSGAMSVCSKALMYAGSAFTVVAIHGGFYTAFLEGYNNAQTLSDLPYLIQSNSVKRSLFNELGELPRESFIRLRDQLPFMIDLMNDQGDDIDAKLKTQAMVNDVIQLLSGAVIHKDKALALDLFIQCCEAE